MKNIDKKKLQDRFNANLITLFNPLINSYIKYYDNPVHYYFLDDETYQFFNQFFEAVDSMSWESLESLKDDLGQYVYVSYYGDPINKEELIQLRDNKSFDDNAFAFHYSENLKDLLGWRSEEIEESEPIRHDDLHELVIIKSLLDVYNDIKK